MREEVSCGSRDEGSWLTRSGTIHDGRMAEFRPSERTAQDAIQAPDFQNGDSCRSLSMIPGMRSMTTSISASVL